MKEKIRNVVVIEGSDLMLGGTIFILLLSTFLKEYSQYIPIVVGITIVGIVAYIYSLLYCIIHCAKNKEFDKGKKIIKIALIIIFELFYVPIYYTKYVIKKKRWIGIVECIVFILGYIVIFGLLGVLYLDGKYMTKTSLDKSITVNLKSSWNCYDKNIGDQKLFCFNLLDQGSFGIFTYNTAVNDDSDILDLMKYHSEQLNKGYLNEGYKIVSSNRKNNYYISELEKDDEKFYTISGVKKDNDKNTIVVAYSGFNKDEFTDIYDNVEYSD